MMQQTTKNARLIKAPADTIYNSFMDPRALETWLAPDTMTGKIDHFEPKVGGGYEMSLMYAATDKEAKGKSGQKEDRYTARFVELKPCLKIVEAINFQTDDPQFQGEMTMEVQIDEQYEGTTVTFLFSNIPVGIKPADNEKGTISTLEKLAAYAEQKYHEERDQTAKEIDEQFSDGSANAFDGK